MNRAWLLRPTSHVFLADLLYTRFFVGDSTVISALQALARSSEESRPAMVLGLLLAEQRDPVGAEREAARAVILDPSNVINHSKRAITFVIAGMRDNAKKSLQCAMAIDPRWLEAQINYAYILEAEGEYEAALTRYLDIIQQAPDVTAPYFNAAICRLSLGRFEDAWEWYEHRWSMNSIVSLGQDHRIRRFKSTKPKFDGSSVHGLLIWGEQGVGDEIMFASMLPEVTNDIDQIYLLADQRLQALFRRSFPTINVLDNDLGTRGITYDAHTPIGSLARYYRRSANDFNRTSAYLVADTMKTSELSHQIDPRLQKVIGISWRSVNQDNGPERSIPLQTFFELMDDPTIGWVNLQYDFSSIDLEIIQRMGRLVGRFFEFPSIDKRNDLDDVASLMMACDCVVSIGNSVAHLAGALGKETFVLVPTAGSWRWMSSGSGTVWYPSVNVFRKGPREDWTSVLARLRRVVLETT